MKVLKIFFLLASLLVHGLNNENVEWDVGFLNPVNFMVALFDSLMVRVNPEVQIKNFSTFGVLKWMTNRRLRKLSYTICHARVMYAWHKRGMKQLLCHIEIMFCQL